MQESPANLRRTNKKKTHIDRTNLQCSSRRRPCLAQYVCRKFTGSVPDTWHYSKYRMTSQLSVCSPKAAVLYYTGNRHTLQPTLNRGLYHTVLVNANVPPPKTNSPPPKPSSTTPGRQTVSRAPLRVELPRSEEPSQIAARLPILVLRFRPPPPLPTTDDLSPLRQNLASAGQSLLPSPSWPPTIQHVLCFKKNIEYISTKLCRVQCSVPVCRHSFFFSPKSDRYRG